MTQPNQQNEVKIGRVGIVFSGGPAPASNAVISSAACPSNRMVAIYSFSYALLIAQNPTVAAGVTYFSLIEFSLLEILFKLIGVNPLLCQGNRMC